MSHGCIKPLGYNAMPPQKLDFDYQKMIQKTCFLVVLLVLLTSLLIAEMFLDTY